MDERILKVKDFEKEDMNNALKTVIKNTDGSCVVVWVVKPGQSVKCHKHDNADDIWYILEGEGKFHKNVGEDTIVKAGDVIINKVGDCHGIYNHTEKDLKFLGVLTHIPANYEALED